MESLDFPFNLQIQAEEIIAFADTVTAREIL
jgi:hypothetical protein